MYMKNNLLIATVFVLLIGGCQRQKETICGVPVQGTPWQLAAAIADKGDGSFIPESVYRVNVDEAIIEGWLINDESKNRPFIWCEVKDNQVVSAAFKTTLEELEE